MKKSYDVAIIGSGFSGSILARILATRGRSVVLFDSAKHPRFAIGESSTPIADMLLQRLGEQYDLPDLVNLSSYGRWQATLPDLACGLKRGFSYFDHRKSGGLEPESFLGQRSLIVAASPSDEASDTHWYRSDVDAFLFRKAKEAGVDAFQENAVIGLDVVDSQLAKIQLESGSSVSASYVIDASGPATVVASLLGLPPLTNRLQTRTSAAFAHFRGVESFSKVFNARHGDQRAFDPFDADDAAQHHLIDEGWVWMLRMNNSVTSVGVVSPLGPSKTSRDSGQHSALAVLHNRFEAYPDLNSIIANAEIVGPSSGVVTIPRLQRLYDPLATPRCLMMPTTAVAIDPLHSTGIAHALAGVGRIAEILLNPSAENAIHQYQNSILAEALQIDRLVSMCYNAIGSFDRFTVACMVYFAAAIACEERIGAGEIPGALWLADDSEYTAAIAKCAAIIDSGHDDVSVRSKVRNLINPWNTTGLIDDTLGNRYSYTATKGGG